MPAKINVDDLLNHFLLMQNTEEGLLHSEKGQVTSHESFKIEMAQGFKSIGQSGQKKI